ncbi:MAG: glutaredoxin 3 [Sphingomicrobium sp.]
MADVEIYIKVTCPYCIRAKRMLDMKGVEYREYDVGRDRAKFSEMVARSAGRSTVPQIFLDGLHIGGCDDLFSLEMDGKLTEMLAAT